MDALPEGFSRRLDTLLRDTAIERIVVLVCEDDDLARVLADYGAADAGAVAVGAVLSLPRACTRRSGPCEIADLGEAGKPLADLGFSGLAVASNATSGSRVVLAARGERGRALRPRDLAELGSAAQHLVAGDDRAGIASRLESLDEQVCRLDRLAALGGLVAEIVHEIRNPLVSVKTLLELLPEQGDDPELLENFLPVALDEIRRVERLLENVLSHARPSAGSGGADVHDAIASVTQLLSQRARASVVSLESDCEDALPAAAIGEDELRQVLLNLCINALDASPQNGRVRIAASSSHDALRIEVSDEGPGVPSELREKLFEPFFSTKDGATGGLGLAISRRIASACGGRLTVGDGSSGGAVFQLEVPVERAD
ncbi:MAG: hypothetical protein HKP27_01120, partial [Myxococcales bacterium]|nr:hypothetical protein [Myxococcales bacterium]